MSQSPGTITLQDAIRMALQNSPDMRLARAQYDVALGQARVDRSAFHPNLYTGTGLAYTHGFPSLPGGQAPSVFELDYQQTIFNPMLRGQQHADEDRAKNSKIEMDRVRDGIIVQTATAYLNLADAQHSLLLLQTEQTSSQTILQIVQERQRGNLALPIDVTRAQLTLAQIAENTVKLQDQEQALEQQLRQLTGIPRSQPIQASPAVPAFAAGPAGNAGAAEQLSITPPALESESNLIDLAVQNDRTVKEAENERAAREQEYRGARWSYFPTVAIVGQYSILSKFNNYNEFYKTFERNNVNIGVQVTVPIFAAKTSATVALAKSQLSEADLQLGQRQRQVTREIQQKVANVRELDAGREVARLDLQLAQQNLQIEQDKFNGGRATLQEIEQARLDESQKWVAFLNADFAREQAQLVLLEATGQLAKVLQ
ncbi:MAG: TolC family protein [Acidobacteriota bacterium]|nr:TolC family protein [Acidobacteriota bacterium]